MATASRMYWCLLVLFTCGVQLLCVDQSIAEESVSKDVVSKDTVSQKNVFEEKGAVGTLAEGVNKSADASRLNVISDSRPGSIRETIEMALLNHPSLHVKGKDSAIKSAELREIKAAYYPQVLARLGVGRENSNNQTTRSATGFGSDVYVRRESSLNVRQKLYDGNKTYMSQVSKERELDASETEYRHQASEIGLEAIKAHFAVMKANKVLSFHIESLNTHERIAKDVGIRARSGRDDRARVNQISARLSLALANIELAKQNRSTAVAQYESVVGEGPSNELSYQVGLMAMPESKELLVNEVLENNIWLKFERLNESSSEASYKAARAHRYPDLFLEAGASWNDNLDGVRGHNGDAYLMLRMEYELYGGGASNARQVSASLKREQAGYRVDLAKRVLTGKAEEAWYQYESSSKRLALLQDYVESAESTKSAYVKQFNIGQRSLIDLLDAENELLQARRMRVDVEYELRSVKHEILHLQGRLLN